jgi:cation diffusion facilitator CzcD-associated flavoprotein CzcO
MYTFGFNFRPWTEARTLADGPSIKQYLIDTAKEYGVDKKIRYGRKVLGANWSSAKKLWTVDVLDEVSGKTEQWTASFLVSAAGYYNYDTGFRPDFPGEKSFKGQIVHPQHWPEKLDYTGKRVVIIGSGATAITLVPSMADKAAHVTMLQRSPTYIMSVPAVDPISKALQAMLPEKLAYQLNRARNVGLQRMIYLASRKRPAAMRRLILKLTKRQLQGTDIDLKHFSPSYNPWDQRLCVVPDGDLFKALRAGKASIATDQIERFTADGILLKSGETLPADIIITATGLDVQLLGGAKLTVDGEAVPLSERMTYKGLMLEGVPNAAMVIGYTNISWTLKADIVGQYLCRLFKHMDRKGYKTVVANGGDGERTDDTVLGGLTSGYLKRAADRLPRQGKAAPWSVLQDYLFDATVLRLRPIEDGVIEFDGKPKKPGTAERIAAPLFKAYSNVA